MPNPARVGRKGTRRARVNPIGIRRIDPNRFLKSSSTDAGDNRVAESRRVGGQRSCDQIRRDCLRRGRWTMSYRKRKPFVAKEGPAVRQTVDRKTQNNERRGDCAERYTNREPEISANSVRNSFHRSPFDNISIARSYRRPSAVASIKFLVARSLTSNIKYRTSNIREMRVLMISAEGPPS